MNDHAGRLRPVFAFHAACWTALCGASLAPAQSYRIERIASGLNQPTYVTQAPGDPANILYFTERTSDTIGGFGAVNDMGKVWRYDVDTRSKSLVLDLSNRSVTNDTGLQTIAFSPDFNTLGAPTYHKMYVSSSARGNTAANRVEEYSMNPDGTFGSARTVLRYDNNAQNNHTVNWIGFDPTSTGAERDYLYISTGDGAFGLPYNNGTSPNGRPSQNPADIAGKILRVDVAGGDAYAGDNRKNYAIPATNPLPVYNAANPANPINGLGEVWATGVRNGYRASFDRLTGDFYYGDVGETAIEEVNFIKAGSNAAGPPIDLGWPQREGTNNSGINGAPQTTTNPFTGVTSLEPIQQYTHSVGQAVMGGYVYRGPIAELQGKYFFADFVQTGRTWMLDFDRNSDPATFNGNNGTLTPMSALWQSLVVDPTDPTYQPSSSILDVAGLDHIVSFGEDNAGNLYLVDIGNRSASQNGFDGQYPNAGLGEIFRVVPAAEMTLTIDRQTGAVTLANKTGSAADIRGYSIVSGAGGIDPSLFTPITGRLDAPPGGDGSVDPDDPWQITSPSGSHVNFSEATTGDGGTLAIGQSITLSPADGWIQSPFEDLQFTVTLGDGSVLGGLVAYVGNNGLPFDLIDLNFDGSIDVDDWVVFRDFNASDMTDLTGAQRQNRGDLDGDGDNDFQDFRRFKEGYDQALGAGAFAAAVGEVIPEPTPQAMLVFASLLAALIPRRYRKDAP